MDGMAGFRPQAQAVQGRRVLFVNHASRMGGAEQVLLALLPGFHGRAGLWLFEDGPLRDRAQALGVPALLPPGASAFDSVKRDASLLRALPMLGGLLRGLRGIARAAADYELLYANSQKAFVLAAPASVIARRPLIWHLHDILTPAHFGAQQLRLLRLLSRIPARIIVPSRAAAEAFVQLCGATDRLRVVPNGVSLPPAPAGEDRAALRHRLGLPDAPLVGVFSRLSPWKGQDVALRALADLPGVHGIFAGAPLFGEADYAQKLQSLSGELQIAARTHFLGHRDDVPELMRAMDVVLHPSVDPEPFGRTLVEAMLSRVPLVATATGAAPEILADGAAGLLVPPRDAAAMAEALRQWLRGADPALLDRAERRAREDYAEAGMRAGIHAVVDDPALAARA